MAKPLTTTNQQHFLTQPIPRERLDGLSEVRRSQERPLVSLQTTRVDSSSTEKKDAGVYRSRRAIPFSAAPCDSPQASAPPRAGEEAATPPSTAAPNVHSNEAETIGKKGGSGFAGMARAISGGEGAPVSGSCRKRQCVGSQDGGGDVPGALPGQ